MYVHTRSLPFLLFLSSLCFTCRIDAKYAFEGLHSYFIGKGNYRKRGHFSLRLLYTCIKPGVVGKQHSPRCDASERGVPSGAILFAQINVIEK